MSLPVADIIILIIIITSGLMALLRGFVREVLTIVAWVGAALFAAFTFGYVKPLARTIFNPLALADISAFLFMFLLALIPLFIVTTQIGRRLGRDNPGVVDRTGGFLFGVARGLFLVALAYWVHSIVLEPGAVPFWAKDSRLQPIITGVASIFPTDINALATSSDAPSSRGKEPEAKKDESAQSDDGYGQQDRRGLDQLITTPTDD
jgi:membrane protein required for colicin V production